MRKLIRDGKVAVLISPNFGSGFHTWGFPLEAVFDPELVLLVEAGDCDAVQRYCETHWPNNYSGGARDLIVVWVPIGTQFRIHEYDGSESIQTLDDTVWYTA